MVKVEVYRLLGKSTLLTLPRGAQPLHVAPVPVPEGVQGTDGRVDTCIWLLVDTDQPTEHRKFLMVDTAEPLPLPSVLHADPIGSFIHPDDGRARHVMEVHPSVQL